MVMVILMGNLHALCANITEAERRFGTAWTIESQVLPSGDLIYTMKIGV